GASLEFVGVFHWQERISFFQSPCLYYPRGDSAITIRHRRSSTSGACPPPESPGPLTEKTYGLQNAGLSDKTVLSTTNREDVKHLAGSTIKVGDDWRATMILRRRLGEMEFVNEPNYLEFAMYRPHPVI
ncbi:hypothetical protein AB0365_16985, partial [Brevibacterium casei]|uniref:hypothetical protein n=1 Tax=Brevibacterium casei TaxID=33889 RepID=UPI00344E7EAC